MPVSDELRDVGGAWYEIVTDTSLRQGDIFRGLVAYWLPDDLAVVDRDDAADGVDNTQIEFLRGDWIVLSASCDIQQRTGLSKQQVLMGRLYECTGENLNNAKTDKDIKERVEVLRRGLEQSKFLLPEHRADPRFPLSFVLFRLQVTLPLTYVVRNCTGPRLRLKPPHRENFGAWAGQCLGRVGIEDAEQIRFAKSQGIYPSQVIRAVEADEAAQ